VGSNSSVTQAGKPIKKRLLPRTAKNTTKAESESMASAALPIASAAKARYEGGVKSATDGGRVCFFETKLTRSVAAVCETKRMTAVVWFLKSEAAVPNKNAALALLASDAERYAEDSSQSPAS